MTALGVFLFLFFLFMAIAVHEFGHFVTAKLFGMKVERFFIGFGAPLWSIKRGETEYGIATLPFGGYVRIAGMNPLEPIHPEDRDRVFKAKPGWQQAIVLVAGSFTHFLVAFVIAIAVFTIAGVADKPTRTIESVSATLANGQAAPAGQAGFRAGDTVLAVNGKPVTTWDQARSTIRANPDRDVTFLVQRGKQRLTLRAHLADQNPNGEHVGFLGVATRFTHKRLSPVRAVVDSGKLVGVGSWESLKGLWTIVSPRTIGRLFSVVIGRSERRATDPASVVGIGRAAGQVASKEGIAELLMTVVVGFNLFIGVANLLPLPPLDGGHLAVLGYETLRQRSRRWRREGKRTVDMQKLLPVSVVVVGVLVTLFVLSLYLDIVKPLPSLPG